MSTATAPPPPEGRTGELPLVSLEGIVKRFGAVHALKGVSLEVAAGEVLGLIGANGAGKSTLMNALASVIKPDSGSVHVGENDLTSATPRQAIHAGVSRVPQEVSLVGDHSVAENVLLGGLPASGGLVKGAALHSQARGLLSRVGLGEEVDTHASAGELTPVQQRLVTIAHALARDPRVVILDEPSAALPTETAAVLGTITQKLAAEGVAIIYVSHRLEEVRDLCARVVAMRDGGVAGELVGSDVQVAPMVRLVGGSDLEQHEVDSEHAATVSRRSVVIRARGLCANRVTDVDLDVHEGEILGVGGLYGAGRSELLRLLGGIQRPSAGTVTYGDAVGPRSPHEARRQRVGYVAEGRAQMILHGMTVQQNASVSNLAGLSFLRSVVRGGREREAVEKYTKRVGLIGSLDGEISTLSGGNQQKVFLARWLLRGCSTLLLDEPTVGIDVHARAEIHGLLAELAMQGTTIVMASAEPEELVTMCDRVVVLVEGHARVELSRPFEAASVVSASYSAAA